MQMTMPKGLALLAGLWLVGGGAGAQAQGIDPPKLFASVNVGGQTHSHSVLSGQSLTIYAEAATIVSTHQIGGGFLLDLGAGYRVTDDLAVAVSVSRVAEETPASVTGVIPDPNVFGRPATTIQTLDGLDRREVGVHLQAVWFLPSPGFMRGADVALTAGPSFFTVRQDLVTGASVPFGTQDVVPEVSAETKSSVGVNVGLDVSYVVRPRIGVGGFVRYAGASFDFDSAPDDKAGGFQAGVGLRLSLQ